MEIRAWNAQQIQKEFPACESLKDIVREIEELLWKTGRVVCTVKVNGMCLSEEDESRLASSGLAEIESIEIAAQMPRLLVRDTIQSIVQLLPELTEASIQAADLFRQNKRREAQELLGRLLDGCRWFTDSLGLIKESARRWPDLGLDTQFFSQPEAQMKASTRDVLAALESKDLIQLADILEYDFSNSLGAWAKLLSAVRTMID